MQPSSGLRPAGDLRTDSGIDLFVVRPDSTRRVTTQAGDPLSLDEAAALLGGDAARASQALTHLASRGDFLKVRQRLWLRSGAPVDPFRLGARITAPYTFAYGTALVLHGGSAVQRTEMLVSSPHRFDPFGFAAFCIGPPNHGSSKD